MPALLAARHRARARGSPEWGSGQKSRPLRKPVQAWGNGPSPPRPSRCHGPRSASPSAPPAATVPPAAPALTWGEAVLCHIPFGTGEPGSCMEVEWELGGGGSSEGPRIRDSPGKHGTIPTSQGRSLGTAGAVRPQHAQLDVMPFPFWRSGSLIRLSRGAAHSRQRRKTGKPQFHTRHPARQRRLAPGPHPSNPPSPRPCRPSCSRA